MSQFQDHFSGHAKAYAAFRPRYPSALFAFLDDRAPRSGPVWDVATGSGQAATALASLGRTVMATDASIQQLQQANPHPRVQYAVALAERAPLPTQSVSLVTVAQALHWFDAARFFGEVKRVLAPGGMVAVWCYGLFRIGAGVDALVDELHDGTVGSYWPRERGHLEAACATLPFPFELIEAGPFDMVADWSVEQVMGYLSTWSAVRRYMAHRGTMPAARASSATEGLLGKRRSPPGPLAADAQGGPSQPPGVR